MPKLLTAPPARSTVRTAKQPEFGILRGEPVDDFTFDAVARAVAMGASRRQALRLLAGSFLAGWLPQHAWAAPTRQNDACDPGLTYCPPRSDGQPEGCYDLASDYFHCGSCDMSCPSASPGPVACIGGECVATGCAEGLTDCTGNLDCVDLSSDPSNCGACGVVCDSGVCAGGSCTQVGCAAGLTYCEEQPGWAPAGCYDLSSDYLHCGSCMHQCPSAGPVEMTCSGGECVVTDCGDLTDCTGNLDCTSLADDPNNCGACGVVCDSGICEAGSCYAGCGSGLAYCPSRQITVGFDNQPSELAAGCFDLFSDNFHCGSCDITCPSTVPCTAGECALPSCDEGLTICAAGCVDLETDPANCGDCDIVCAAGEICDGGVCGPDTTCTAGLSYCPAKAEVGNFPAGCYDLSADADHCGSCDNSCVAVSGPTNLICVDGACQPCSEGIACGNTCYDLSSDPNHCGVCYVACAAGEVCEAGKCAATPTLATGDATPPTTSPPDSVANAQEAANAQEPGNGATGGSERTKKTPRDRTEQGTTAASGATNRDNGSTAGGRTIKQAGSSTPASVLVWPFDAKAGQWTIVHGYRAADEDTTSAATPTAERRDFARLALEFAVCPAEDVDAADGTCDLGVTGSDPTWDREATQGSTIVSPVDGTVAWTDGEAPCLAIGIDIAGHAGYRLALFNVEGNLERGQRVTRGKRIGKVPKRGCERGDRLRMALYQPQQQTNDDPVAEREGVPFTGEWAIAGCEYPDDKRTAEQYRGDLAPCSPEDTTSPSP